jgi:hypothetical protein
MITACFFATNLLCIGNDYRMASQRASIFSIPSDTIPKQADPAVAKRLGVEITIVAEDEIMATPLNGLDSTCVEGQCIYYWKRCDESSKQCSYAYAPLSEINYATHKKVLLLENISIRYQSIDALQKAESQIYVAVSDEKKRGGVPLVPLSSFKTSALPKLPVCQMESAEPGCYGPATPP